MTEPTHSTTDWLATRRRYKQLMYGLLGVGLLGLFAGYSFDQFIVGVIIYWAGFFGMIGIWQLSPVTLYDERETAIERKASDYTLGVFAFVLVVGWPGGLALEEAGVMTLPPTFVGAMWALVAVYTVFSLIYTVLRRRS